MKLILTLSVAALLLPSAEGKKVMLDLTSDIGDQLRAELMDLEGTTAMLRRSDGKEFATPLAYLSPKTRDELRKTWKEYQAEVSKPSLRSTKPLDINSSPTPETFGTNRPPMSPSDSSGPRNHPRPSPAATDSTPGPDTNSPAPNPRRSWLTVMMPGKPNPFP